MHYVICYDITNDRLRERVGKDLERNGCLRLQKSVFIAPDLKRPHLDRLRAALRKRLERRPMDEGDSIYFIPLPNEAAMATEGIPNNSAYASLFAKPRKIIL